MDSGIGAFDKAAWLAAFAAACLAAPSFSAEAEGAQEGASPVHDGTAAQADESAPESAATESAADATAAFATSVAGDSACRAAGDRLVIEIAGIEVPVRWCPPGSFEMGSPDDEIGRYSDETMHKVTFTKGFWIGETEVTQELWVQIMGTNPSFRKSGSRYPVENVSWDEYHAFLAKLNARAPEGWSFALPTEAQWEYACRAGSTDPYAGSGLLDDMGWYTSNSGGRTHPVAQKSPNDWGLYDMHGNVLEWCEDRYGSYPEEDVVDQAGVATGESRVLRGGSSWRDARFCRSAFRFWNSPSRRFRLSGIRLVATRAGGAPEPAP